MPMFRMPLRRENFSLLVPNIVSILIYIVSALTTLVSAVLFGPSKWGEVSLYYQILTFSVAIGSFGLPTFLSLNYFRIKAQLAKKLSTCVTILTGISCFALFFILQCISHFDLRFIDIKLYFLSLIFTSMLITIYEIYLGRMAAIRLFNVVSTVRLINVSVSGFLISIIGLFHLPLNTVIIAISITYVGIVLIFRIVHKRGWNLVPEKQIMHISHHDDFRQDNSLTNAIKSLWKIQFSLFLMFFSLKCDLLFVAVSTSSSNFAIFSIAVLCAEVGLLFANGFYLPRLLNYSTQNRSAIDHKSQYLLSTLNAILLLLFMNLLLNNLSRFDFLAKYDTVKSIFLPLALGTIFLLVLKMEQPRLLNIGRYRFVNSLFCIIILIKSTILFLPSGLSSIYSFSVISMLAYAVAALGLILDKLRVLLRRKQN